jgi:hypothetical protein
MATVKVGYTVKHTFNKKYIKDQLRKMQDGVMLVGWDKNQYEEDEKGQKTNLLTAEAAYLNEVGHYIHHKNGKTTHVVARPFLSYTVAQNGKHWFAVWRKMVRMYFEGQYKTFKQIMQKLCTDYIIEDIRKTVEVEKPFAPLKPSTLARRKRYGINRDTPLVNMGTMIDTLTYEIRTKGK